MEYPGLDSLIGDGWPISEQRLAECFGARKFCDSSKLLQTLLDSDIRDYSAPLLMDRVNNRLGELKGPVVVQISKLRNVLCSKIADPCTSGNETVNRIQLTDGHSSISALQCDPIPALTVETAPGTKVLLLGTIPMEGGLVLINAANCRVLGGQVSRLIDKWNLEKNWLFKQARNLGNSSAPQWVPFTKKKSNFDDTFQSTTIAIGGSNGDTKRKTKNIRANDVINNQQIHNTNTNKDKDKDKDKANETTTKSKENIGGGEGEVDDEEVDEFSVARKAQIQQIIAENKTPKKFASTQIKIKQPQTIISESSGDNKAAENKRKETANAQTKQQSGPAQRKGRRPSNRKFNDDDGDDDDELALMHQRPSKAPTLFDFVQSKVPQSDAFKSSSDATAAARKTEPSRPSSGFSETQTAATFAPRGRGGGGGGGNRRPERNFFAQRTATTQQRGASQSGANRGERRNDVLGRGGAGMKRGAGQSLNSSSNRAGGWRNNNSNRGTTSSIGREQRNSSDVHNIVVNNRTFPALNEQTQPVDRVAQGVSRLNISASTSSTTHENSNERQRYEVGNKETNSSNYYNINNNRQYNTNNSNNMMRSGAIRLFDEFSNPPPPPPSSSSSNGNRTAMRFEEHRRPPPPHPPRQRLLQQQQQQQFTHHYNAPPPPQPIAAHTIMDVPQIFLHEKSSAYIVDGFVEQQQQQPYVHNVMPPIEPVWKIGDKCLAPWSDGQLYMSTLVSLGPADMCCVEYDGYGNTSTIPLGALVMLPSY